MVGKGGTGEQLPLTLLSLLVKMLPSRERKCEKKEFVVRRKRRIQRGAQECRVIFRTLSTQNATNIYGQLT